MSDKDRDWELELEESAQGTDLFEAPGSDIQSDEAREAAADWSSGAEPAGTATDRVERARTRRHSLGDAMTDMEMALASPAAAEGWFDTVAEALDELREALQDHVNVTEGKDGLLEEVLEVAPRLEGEIDLIRAEHEEMLDTLERADLTLKGIFELSSLDPEPVRRRVMTLLGRLSLHRQRGADLVYEAYNVDIATAD